MKFIQRFISYLVIFAVLTLVGCAGTDTSRSTGTFIDDATISTKVKTQLAADSLTQAFQVQVETYDGTVQLSGFVDNVEVRQRAEEIARGVAGVKTVKNNLDVK